MPALEIPLRARTFCHLVVFPPCIRRLAAFCFGLLAFAAARAQVATPPPTLYGEVKGTTYVAPGARFRMTIPVLPELGGQIRDTENVVTFDDPVSTHVSIACFPLDLSNKWELETRGIRDYLEYFFKEFVFPDFAQRFPGSTNEASLYSPQLRDGALFVFSLLPGGSAFEARSSVLEGPVNGPAVAKRGTLLFVQNNNIFILTAELAERVTQRSAFQKTPEQENEILRSRLVELANRIQLPKPSGAAR
ncbi:MAG: hypothetical protein KF715_01465 [Candidatus Didemnitutus sp.]|nr:hypothetical protein [Candidatus Didemnitutus sp.]